MPLLMKIGALALTDVVIRERTDADVARAGRAGARERCGSACGDHRRGRSGRIRASRSGAPASPRFATVATHRVPLRRPAGGYGCGAGPVESARGAEPSRAEPGCFLLPRANIFEATNMNGIYCGPPPLPDEIWTRWNPDPVLIAALLMLAAVLRRDRAGLLGVAVLAVAFVSPLCALSSALFSGRVAHHVLLVAVARPLLARAVLSDRAGPIALPFAVATATLWFWHVPAAYDLALSHKGVYWAMQITLIASAVWFWRGVLARRRDPVEALIYVVAGFAQMGMLGALLTFTPEQLYAAHAFAPMEWGLTPLADQQFGGLLMWVPAGLPYAVAAVLVARRGWAGLQGGAA